MNQQISVRLGPIIDQMAVARGANVAFEEGMALYNADSIDITADVLAQLNRALPSVSITPMPQPAQPQQPAQQQPQGR